MPQTLTQINKSSSPLTQINKSAVITMSKINKSESKRVGKFGVGTFGKARFGIVIGWTPLTQINKS